MPAAPPVAAPGLARVERLERPLDLHRTLGPLRRGTRDRCMLLSGPVSSGAAVWRATRTPDGPVTLRLRVDPGEATLRGLAWGPGAGWAIEHVRDLAGADDDDSELAAMLARPGGGKGADLLRALHGRLAGLRIPATRAVTEALVPTILEQKVTGVQARRSYGSLVDRLGTPAPGPGGLRLPPAPGVLASTPSWAFHRAGVEGKRAGTIIRACRHAQRLGEAACSNPLEVKRRLAALPGIGSWSVAEVSKVALGDADAVSVGDYHLHDQVAWALAGLPRGGDDIMLELLEPYRGQRGRVTRLIEAGGIVAPRFGPRLTVQAIEAI